ncbi:hypothetical protein [Curtobacterium sp. VKM Ac-1395]|uniref:hypothetical protein n=1 Tax=Curtobacterium sp. VKM Ac-1395 TaxID=2783815 RepID=UPI00188BFB4D|nr:hypothetical protein [Curtobacterium sp. VKM Ac-1395]MBF4592042.1 hypothetical protein [Curtobacterium sp. VKM Ac-1395]
MTNTIQDVLRRELVRYLVSKAITCAYTGRALDVRTCVVINGTDGDPAIVISPEAYDAMTQDTRDALTERGFTITDPRTEAGA